MIKNLEGQKKQLKEKLMKEADEYFEKFEKSSNGEDFNIDKIEKIMAESRKNIKKVLDEASSELTGNIEVEVKKNVRNAETGLKGLKSARKRR